MRKQARVRWTFALAGCSLLWCSAGQAQDVTLDAGKRQVAVGRLRFTVGDNGLPAQIVIQAAPTDLPLEFRGAGAKQADESLLAELGRGAQLAAPLELVATVGKEEHVLAAKAPAGIEEKDGGVHCAAELSGGGVTAALRTSYTRGGAVRIDLAYRGGTVDALALVMRMAGPVDTVVQGVAPFDDTECGLPDAMGLLWGNAAPAEPKAKERRAGSQGKAEVPRYLFWGSGDRGFSLVCEKADGWVHAPAAPAVTLTREDAGGVTWRALLVNHPTKLETERRVQLTLLTHPATLPAADRRRSAWIAWPHENDAAATPAIAAASPAGAARLLRADCATAYEAHAAASLLAGPAGGDALSVAQTLADSFSLPLFRYLAGTHTGLPARLLANTPKLSRPGMNPGADRMALARVLLHDIGFDHRGAVHRVQLGRVVSALAEFGLFEADSQTEFLPYWRSKSTIRYGEPFSKDNAFEVTAADPMQRVQVSVWLRPHGKARKALILIANEGERPVREQFYILNAAKLFGTANAVTRPELVAGWDFAGIPDDSDWAKTRAMGEAIVPLEEGVRPRSGKSVPFLADLEDGGGVAQSVRQGEMEVYQRAYVPARGFRLLFGSGKAK